MPKHAPGSLLDQEALPAEFWPEHTAELVAAIRAFCSNPAADQAGAWLFGTI